LATIVAEGARAIRRTIVSMVKYPPTGDLPIFAVDPIVTDFLAAAGIPFEVD
jgi:hypothetical protein